MSIPINPYAGHAHQAWLTDMKVPATRQERLADEPTTNRQNEMIHNLAMFSNQRRIREMAGDVGVSLGSILETLLSQKSDTIVLSTGFRLLNPDGEAKPETDGPMTAMLGAALEKLGKKVIYAVADQSTADALHVVHDAIGARKGDIEIFNHEGKEPRDAAIGFLWKHGPGVLGAIELTADPYSNMRGISGKNINGGENGKQHTDAIFKVANEIHDAHTQAYAAVDQLFDSSITKNTLPRLKAAFSTSPEKSFPAYQKASIKQHIDTLVKSFVPAEHQGEALLAANGKIDELFKKKNITPEQVKQIFQETVTDPITFGVFDGGNEVGAWERDKPAMKTKIPKALNGGQMASNVPTHYSFSASVSNYGAQVLAAMVEHFGAEVGLIDKKDFIATAQNVQRAIDALLAKNAAIDGCTRLNEPYKRGAPPGDIYETGVDGIGPQHHHTLMHLVQEQVRTLKVPVGVYQVLANRAGHDVQVSTATAPTGQTGTVQGRQLTLEGIFGGFRGDGSRLAFLRSSAPATA